MTLDIKRGRTSKIVRLFVQDTRTTDGSGLTGLLYNTAGLVCFYSREGDSSATAIPLVAGAAGTWISGGFVALDQANMPGVYELGLPDAVLALGESAVVQLRGAANMAVSSREVGIDAVDRQNAVSYGLSNLDAKVSSRNAGAVVIAANGLDAMLTDVVSDADSRSSGIKMLRAVFNRFYNLVRQTAVAQTVANDAGTTVSTMPTTDDGTTASKSKSA